MSGPVRDIDHDRPLVIALRETSLSGEPGPLLNFQPRLVILGGYAARDAEERRRHIDELATIGINPPDTVPAFWAVSNNLLTTDERIQVQGGRTSGEIEFALLFQAGLVYVAAASDQTDREFEVHSIPRSKQMCAKVLSRQVVRLDQVRRGWDDNELYSDVLLPHGWVPYQRSSATSMLAPDDLISACFGDPSSVPDGTVLLSGTVSLVDGVTHYATAFRGGLRIPSSAVDLSLRYDVDVLPGHADLLAMTSRRSDEPAKGSEA